MKHAWLGRSWDEVQLELENLGKPYAFQITRPHGKMDSWGNCRVVRIREFSDLVEVILAHENFSPRKTLTP